MPLIPSLYPPSLSLFPTHILLISNLISISSQSHLNLISISISPYQSHLHLISSQFQVLEIVEVVKKVSGKPLPVQISAARPGDPPTLYADPAKINYELS